MILIVNHKFALAGGAKEKSGNIQKISDGLPVDGEYVVERSPYGIYSETICGFQNKMCCRKEDVNDGSSVTDSSCFVQEDCPDDEFATNTKVLPHYMYFSTEFASDSGNVISVDGEHTAVLRDNEYEVSKYYVRRYSDMESLNAQKNNLTSQSYRQRQSFIINSGNTDEADVNLTPDELLDEYMKSMDGNFSCYVVSSDATEEILITDDYKPIIITMSRPERIKFNFGYFVPRTYEITHFATNDHVVSSRCDISLLLSGTKIEKIDKLNAYTGNKIIPEMVT